MGGFCGRRKRKNMRNLCGCFKAKKDEKEEKKPGQKLAAIIG